MLAPGAPGVWDVGGAQPAPAHHVEQRRQRHQGMPTPTSGLSISHAFLFQRHPTPHTQCTVPLATHVVVPPFLYYSLLGAKKNYKPLSAIIVKCRLTRLQSTGVPDSRLKACKKDDEVDVDGDGVPDLKQLVRILPNRTTAPSTVPRPPHHTHRTWRWYAVRRRPCPGTSIIPPPYYPTVPPHHPPYHTRMPPLSPPHHHFPFFLSLAPAFPAPAARKDTAALLSPHLAVPSFSRARALSLSYTPPLPPAFHIAEPAGVGAP